jgi:hypothetical protein
MNLLLYRYVRDKEMCLFPYDAAHYPIALSVHYFQTAINKIKK